MSVKQTDYEYEYYSLGIVLSGVVLVSYWSLHVLKLKILSLLS